MAQPHKGERKLAGVRLPVDVHRELSLYAVNQDLTLNDLLLKIVLEYWENHPKHETYQKMAALEEKPKAPKKGSKTKTT